MLVFGLFLFGNLFGGMTVIGWICLLFMALSTNAPEEMAPAACRPEPFIYAPHLHRAGRRAASGWA